MTGGLCPAHWSYYNGNCFFVEKSTKTWQFMARLRCRNWDAKLASISDQTEMDFVKSIS